MMSEMAMLRQKEKGPITQGYTCSDEPKAQTRAVCRQRVRFDGSIPWIRAVLLPAVSSESLAFMVY